MMRPMLVAAVVCSVAWSAVGQDSNSMFTQLQCQDSQCERCDEFAFNQGECYEAQKGLYAKGMCLSVSLRQQLWSSAGCFGTPLSDTNVPLNKCLTSVDQNTWFEELCTTVSGRHGKVAGASEARNSTDARPGTKRRTPLLHIFPPSAGFMRDVLQAK
eukprot:Hpha_TRINITY_DN22380_c0_g1::TRINITY_DN22380_c0_g1_i1::g.177653::m.177653